MQYKVSELAQKANVTKRTIHYYISKGLLMPPIGNGVGSLYDDSHLERLLLIKKLQAEYMPLNKIRDFLFEGKKLDPEQEISQEKIKAIKIKTNSKDVYFRENICNIFEIHYSQENAQKYSRIIENVKKYVQKMLEE